MLGASGASLSGLATVREKAGKACAPASAIPKASPKMDLHAKNLRLFLKFGIPDSRFYLSAMQDAPEANIAQALLITISLALVAQRNLHCHTNFT
jgi:hypothetical protein